MGNKSKGVPRFNNKLQKDFDNRLMNLESSSFTGFLRAEALLDILVEKGIISKNEHSQRTFELYEESKQYYTKDNTETSTKVSAELVISDEDKNITCENNNLCEHEHHINIFAEE